MIKTILKIDGMMCGMCESHINDTIRKSYAVKKVTSSYSKGKTEIISEMPIEKDRLKKAISETVYTLIDVNVEPYEKKSFSLFRKKEN